MQPASLMLCVHVLQQGHPNASPANHWGTKWWKLGGGQNLNLVSWFSGKIKIVATRCHILRLKCIKFEFGWGSAQPRVPDPAGLTSLPQSPRPLSWTGKKKGEGKKGEGGGEEGRSAGQQEGRLRHGLGGGRPFSACRVTKIDESYG